jgi:hypothetical protein
MSVGCAVGSMILPTSRNFPNISKRSQREHDENKDMTRYFALPMRKIENRALIRPNYK